MSERKVLNKYYPPDFDPSKIPRMKLPKNRQYTVRLMAPFNMRCKTCGEYIYKGKKFNARKEDVENEDYFGIRIYRFYIKCTRCLQEISFKTDPKNTDYEIEAGATRNFMALKLAEEQALREEEEAKEEEQSNPMKLLENRTKQSKNEIEVLESLEELKDLKRRQETIDYDGMLLQFDSKLSEREREEKLKQLDEEYIKTIKFHSSQKRKIVVEEEVEILEDDQPSQKVMKPCEAGTSKDAESSIVQTSVTNISDSKPSASFASSSSRNIGNSSSTKKLFAGLVKIKKNNVNDNNNTQSVIKTGQMVNDSDNVNKEVVKLGHATPNSIVSDSKVSEPCVTEVKTSMPSNALSLLAGYSDSDDSEND